MAGGIAGAAMGHILTRANSPAEVHHHHHHLVETNAATSNINVPAATPQIIPPPSPPPPRPSITIERGETLANGCYKQIVKEPSEYDAMSFVATEQLICPPQVTLPILPVQSIATIQPADITRSVVESNPVQPAAIPTNIADTNVNVAESNNALPPQAPEPGYNVPPQPTRFNHDGASLEPLLPQPLPQPPVPQPVQVAPIPSSGVSNPSLPVQVITLSKKIGFYEDEIKKKNSANNVLAVNFVFILLFVGLVVRTF